MTHDIEQDAPALSPTRRTVLTGAAWTLPVIAAATITPMAAASNATTLAFDKSTYNGTACGTITGAYVTVTVNNVATAGKSVTTTLSGGYKFSDGTTTNTQVSGSNGRVNLPAINVPSTGGSGSLVATSSGSSSVTATTTAAAVGSTVKFVNDTGNGNISWPSLPAGVTAKSINAGKPDTNSRVWVYGNDNNVYRSINYGTWTKVSTGTVDAFSAIDDTANGILATTPAC